MDKSDKVLAAIEQLARNLTGQIAAVNAKVDVVNSKVDAVNAKVDAVAADVVIVNAKVVAVAADVVAVAADVVAVAADVSVLKIGQRAILEHLDVAELKGRVEEQSRTIASLIPTRVAAVPGGRG